MLTKTQRELLCAVVIKPIGVMEAHFMTIVSLMTRGMVEVSGGKIKPTQAGKALYKHIGDIDTAEPWDSASRNFRRVRAGSR